MWSHTKDEEDGKLLAQVGNPQFVLVGLRRLQVGEPQVEECRVESHRGYRVAEAGCRFAQMDVAAPAMGKSSTEGVHSD